MQEQRNILNTRIQRLLDRMAEQNPVLPFECCTAGAEQTAAALWNERAIIGCIDIEEAKWKDLAEEAVEDWMAKFL